MEDSIHAEDRENDHDLPNLKAIPSLIELKDSPDTVMGTEVRAI